MKFLLLAPSTAATSVLFESTGIEVAGPNGLVRIEPFGTDALRVRARATGDIDESLPGALITPAHPAAVSQAVVGDRVRSGNIEAVVQATGLVTVSRVSDGQVLLQEVARETEALGSDPRSPVSTLSFASSRTEGLYGFGEHQQGRLNNKGVKYDMESCLDYGHSKGGEVCLPFVFAASGGASSCSAVALPGCFNDHKGRIYPKQGQPTNQPDLTVQKCVEECDAFGSDYKYAGVEAGTQCYCGTSPPSSDKLADDSDCSYPCAGNSSETCGGDWRMQVYGFNCSTAVGAVEYGMLWNMPNYGGVDFASAFTNWTAYQAPQTDYFISTYGKTSKGSQRAADIMSRYVDAVGHSPMLPDYAAGYWHSRNRYTSQAALLEAAEGFHNRSVPVDVIVIDYHHWAHMGDWSFDARQWPDVEGMMQQLSDWGMRVMVSVWPFSATGSTSIDDVASQGLAVSDSTGKSPVWWDDNNCNAKCYLLDQSKPETREYFWDRLNEGYFKQNISIYWLDASEPEISTSDARAAAMSSIYSKGSVFAAGMMYPYWHTRAIHDGLRSAGKQDGDIIMLTRSAWAGMQRWGAALWSGDTHSTWNSLKVSIPAGLNTQLSGIAWWTTDIGGYSGGHPSDAGFQELVVRWFQYGATCPLFRQHGNRETEIWKYGNASYDAIVKVIDWRRSIKNYVMEQMKLVSVTGTPVNRPLWWDFPGDAEAWAQTSSFMFGPKYLVAPVTEPGVQQWSTYLPAGTSWQYEFDASKVFEGGQTVTVPTPLDEFPLFVRMDSREALV